MIYTEDKNQLGVKLHRFRTWTNHSD